jgi:hypothetical protein
VSELKSSTVPPYQVSSPRPIEASTASKIY